jgi:hypothetical protein
LHVMQDKTRRWLRQIGSEELAALALLGLRAGAAAPGGAGDEDAEEQLDCKDEYQTIWNAYQQQFNGSKNWAKTFAERDKASRGGNVSVLLHRIQELNLDSACQTSVGVEHLSAGRDSQDVDENSRDETTRTNKSFFQRFRANE